MVPHIKIKSNSVFVIPTDTIYGICAPALSRKAVERVYTLRRRTPSKPVIILISSISDLRTFNVIVAHHQLSSLRRLWPGPVSIVLPCPARKFAYLHRGTKTLALRLPKDLWLRSLLKKTGPLVAPSANTEGDSPARTVREAQEYFGANVDLYIDRGRRAGKPSTLVRLLPSGKVEVLRQGASRVPKALIAPKGML